MTQTIIVPLAGEEAVTGMCEAAIPVARALAKRTGASLALASVVFAAVADLPVDEELVGAERQGREEFHNRVDERAAFLERCAARIEDTPVETVVRVGDPAREILALADEVTDPLIVMSTHGRRGLRRVLLGSVAFQVVRDATCPVVVVPPPSEDEPARAPTVERVLVPLDESAVAEGALDHGLAALGDGPLDVVLTEVVEPLVRRGGPVEREYHRLATSTARAYLTDLSSDLMERGHRVELDVRLGYPGRRIAEAVEDYNIDLVVMATRGRSGLGRFVLGSVAEDVLRAATTPLLLVGPGLLGQAEAAVREVSPHVATPQRRRALARDVMQAPVVTAPTDATVEEVARLMLERDIGSVVIVNEAGELAGIVTETDFTGKDAILPYSRYRSPGVFGRLLSGQDLDAVHEAGRLMTARQVMTHPVTVVHETTPVEDVADLMIRHDISRIPVVRDGQPVGIVARHDMLRLLAPPDSVDDGPGG
ncbi:MAG TPA: universal stress protein [Thermomicrobiales bacterium]|nr:universal stress protein [Thermomicrobiales bacterium]